MNLDTRSILLTVVSVSLALMLAGLILWPWGSGAHEAAPAETQELSDVIAFLGDFSPVDAAKDEAVQQVIGHLVRAVLGLATILIVTGDHRLGNFFFPGAGLVRRRGDKLEAQEARTSQMPGAEPVDWGDQHKNEALIASARIVAAGIVLGLTLSA